MPAFLCLAPKTKSLQTHHLISTSASQAVRQDNYCDCGLFLCAYAEFFAKCPPPCALVCQMRAGRAIGQASALSCAAQAACILG